MALANKKTMNEKPYKFTAENFIVVCANCFPGESVLKACPELSATVQISHGICQKHAEEMRASYFGYVKPAGK